jgi:hypothetical protein
VAVGKGSKAGVPWNEKVLTAPFSTTVTIGAWIICTASALPLIGWLFHRASEIGQKESKHRISLFRCHDPF